MLCEINPLAGNKRKKSRYNTPRKKRATTCSTVAEHKYGALAQKLMVSHLKLAMHAVACSLMILQNLQNHSGSLSDSTTKVHLALAVCFYKLYYAYLSKSFKFAETDELLLDINNVTLLK